MSAAHAQPTTLRTSSSSPGRIRTGRRIITAGPIVLDSCRPVRRCSILSVVPVTTSASSTRRARTNARLRASRRSLPKTCLFVMCSPVRRSRSRRRWRSRLPDSSVTGIDFVPRSFVGGPIAPGAALYTLEGDFGFSAPNATEPAPEVGHEVRLINFIAKGNQSAALQIQNFARNVSGDQAFISADHPSGFNRPTIVRFGPDDCAYVADYGAVRDNGEDTHFVGASQRSIAANTGNRRNLEDLQAIAIGECTRAGVGRPCPLSLFSASPRALFASAATASTPEAVAPIIKKPAEGLQMALGFSGSAIARRSLIAPPIASAPRSIVANPSFSRTALTSVLAEASSPDMNNTRWPPACRGSAAHTARSSVLPTFTTRAPGASDATISLGVFPFS